VEVYQRATYLPRFGREVEVRRVPVEGRTVELFARRRPAFVVLSSGGRAGLRGRYVRDWRPGQPIIAELAAATEFFERLQKQELGYSRVARFHTPPRWITPRTNSLDPEITIYARDQGAREPDVS